MAQDARQQLIDWLEAKAFEPVLRARAHDRSDADRAKLAHVQDATRAEIERFRSYRSAEEVIVNFKRDLHSTAAKKVHAELRALGLPVINDLRDAFERKASELGVEGSQS